MSGPEIETVLAPASTDTVPNRDDMTRAHGPDARAREQEGTPMDTLELVKHVVEGEIVYDWRIKGGNGEIRTGTVQGYTERNDAIEAAQGTLGEDRFAELTPDGRVVDVDETEEGE